MNTKNKFFMIITLMFLIIGSTISFAADNTQKNITVVGDSTITVKPDTGHISFSVVTEDKNQSNALSKNNEKANKLIAELKKAGINEKDIVTEYVSVLPVVDYDVIPSKTIAYRANNSILVTTNKLDDLSKLINLGMKSGANSLNNIYYSSSKTDEAYLKALDLAIKNANTKAQTISKAIGAKEYNITSVSEIGTNIYTKSENLSNIELSISDSVETPLIMKDIDVYASVKVEYSYK